MVDCLNGKLSLILYFKDHHKNGMENIMIMIMSHQMIKKTVLSILLKYTVCLITFQIKQLKLKFLTLDRQLDFMEKLPNLVKVNAVDI